MIQAGKLKYRLNLQEPTEELSSFSTAGKVNFSFFRTVKAEKLKLRTEDKFKDGVRPQEIVKFRLRYVEELDTDWRFTCKGKTYNVLDVDEVKANRELIITALRVNE